MVLGLVAVRREPNGTHFVSGIRLVPTGSRNRKVNTIWSCLLFAVKRKKERTASLVLNRKVL